METEWRKIPSFENYECCVVDGSIRSVDRTNTYIDKRNGTVCYRKLKGRIIKTKRVNRTDEHLNINLHKNGVKYTLPVQKIVALTYPEICGVVFDSCVVHHIDGDPHNNCPSNLKVLSRKEHADIHDHGFAKGENGAKNNGRKTVKVYDADFNVQGVYDSTVEAAKALGVTPNRISDSCLHENYMVLGKYYCEYL